MAYRQRMSEKELKRRDLTGMTSSETILSAISALQLSGSEYVQPTEMLGLTETLQEFQVEVTSPHFKVPSTLCMPITDSKIEGSLLYLLGVKSIEILFG